MLKGGADNALGAPAGKDPALDDGFVRRSRIEPAADGGVLALGVFAENDHINIAAGLAGYWGQDSRVQRRRPHADGLVKSPAHRQQQTLQCNMVGNVRVADGAE